MDVIS